MKATIHESRTIINIGQNSKCVYLDKEVTDKNTDYVSKRKIHLIAIPTNYPMNKIREITENINKDLERIKKILEGEN